MSNTRKPLRRTIRGGRSFFFADTAIDKILNMVVTLGSEVWALRERLAAVEAIQERQGSLAAGEVDAFEFSPEQEARMGADRKEFIENLFRVLQEQVDAVPSRASRGGVPVEKAKGGAVFGARGSRRSKPASPAAKPRSPAKSKAKSKAKARGKAAAKPRTGSRPKPRR